MTGTYSTPEECRDAVKQAIQANAQPPNRLTKATLEAMVTTPQSPLDTIRHLQAGVTQWRGRLTEWLVCLEYNSIKNRSHVVTIVNPDPTSRADLLHIVMTDCGYRCVAGPDVKTGTEERMVEAYVKVCHEKHDIAMVDPTGSLTNPRAIQKMRPALREKLERCLHDFPRKKPIPTSFRHQDAMRAAKDLLDYLAYGIRPKARGHHPGIRVPRTRHELCGLKARIIEQTPRCPTNLTTWDRFRHTPVAVEQQVAGPNERDRAADVKSPLAEKGAPPINEPARVTNGHSWPTLNGASAINGTSRKSLFASMLGYLADQIEKVREYDRQNPEQVTQRWGSAFDMFTDVRISTGGAMPQRAATAPMETPPALQSGPASGQPETPPDPQPSPAATHRASPAPHMVSGYTRDKDSPNPQHVLTKLYKACIKKFVTTWTLDAF